jgi:superfamily II DNA or RNA helicase
LIELHDHQKEQVSDLRDALACSKSVLMQAATGAGKSVMASHMIASSQNKGKISLFVVPRIDLIKQMSNTFRQFSIRHSYIASGFPMREAQTYICSLQTLVNCLDKVRPDVVFLDECFATGTKISTPNGLKNIEDIETGDFVYNATGIGKVLAISKRKVYSTSIVRLLDGREIKCTANHPFLSGQGWVNAENLASGQVLVGIQNMPSMWRALSSQNNDKKKRKGRAEGNQPFCNNKVLLDILLQEDGKFNVDARSQGKSFKDAKENRASAINSWWEWTATNKARSYDKRNDGARMDYAVDSPHKNKKRVGLSDSLQNRFRAQGKNESHRSRREQPQFTREEGARLQEGHVFNFPRVESVTTQKRVCGEFVYNMEVEGHPSYFADGILVHNCHYGAAIMDRAVKHYREREKYIVGLSATPARQDNFGMGDWYEDMVTGKPIDWLIDNRYLSDYKIIQPSIKLPKGCVGGNPVAEYMAHAQGLLAIGFCRDKAHGYAMADLFNKSKIPAAFIESDTPQEKRKQIIADFADRKIMVLFNAYLLQMGFDLASQIGRSVNVRCMIDLQPTGSLTTQMQKNGRALRYDKAGDAVIIDLAGNSYEENHGLPSAPRQWFLDTGNVSKRDVEFRKGEIRLLRCDSCYKSTRVGATHCPHCNHRFVFDSKKIKEIDGKLVVITPEMRKADEAAIEKAKKDKRMESGRAQTIEDLKRIADERGYASGWVYRMAKVKGIL